LHSSIPFPSIFLFDPATLRPWRYINSFTYLILFTLVQPGSIHIVGLAQYPKFRGDIYHSIELLRLEDYQQGSLTLNFDLDLSNLNSEVGTDAAERFLTIGLAVFERSQLRNERTNQPMGVARNV